PPAPRASLAFLPAPMPLLAVDPLHHIVGPPLDPRLPGRDVLPWQSLVPLPSSASAYNGLIVLGLLAASGLLAAQVLRRRASPALRYAPVWDCGTPDADPATQYSADSFAQPLKRVLGAALFGATERVSMPPPGDTATARMESTWRDLAWSWGYEPLARTVSWLADRLNALQFLTIRRYLVMVFVALIVLLLAVVVWR
ncbi:MAG: hydrogenase 4 subunit B, partial [Proteobacteria bacterium]